MSTEYQLNFKEFGKLLRRGSPKVLDLIRDAKNHGITKSVLDDFVRNRIVIEVARTPKGPEREAIRNLLKELEPDINKLFKGGIRCLVVLRRRKKGKRNE